MAIKLLDDRLINKIAAGEVIERPASIVKELVENAIDAGSSRITVLTTGGGIERIEIVDNGVGIAANDVALAFQRHATSKIAVEADLASILTMGFRGEALPSIASVSKMELYTQGVSSANGVRVIIEGGRELELGPFPTAPGTKVIVKDLFYNTPARKKFLKSPVSEGIHIHETMSKLALSRPDIAFSYSNEKKLFFKTPGGGNLRDAVLAIYGQDWASKFIDIEMNGEKYSMQGMVSKPEFSRANRKNQFFYVNNRLVKSPMLSKAVDEAYRGLLLAREYPAVVLFINIEASEVDVNVHPQKTEVRFLDEKLIFRLVNRGIRDNLEKGSFASSTGILDANRLFNTIINRGRAGGMIYQPNTIPDSFIGDGKIAFPDSEYKEPFSELLPNSDQTDTNEWAIIGQCFQAYILLEKDGNLWLVDQHAAHERIMYNRLWESHRSGEDLSQILAFPLVFDLSTAGMELLEAGMEEFRSIGFNIDILGTNSAIIRSAPSLLQGREVELVNECLSLLEDERPANIQHEILAMAACKQAVKAGQRLSRQEMAMIINDLVQTENYRNCPHGRPTIYTISHEELDKRFKRK